MSEKNVRESTTETLGKLLDESGMQVTFTGWKAELELTEKKLLEAQAEIAMLKAQVEWLNKDCEICKINDTIQKQLSRAVDVIKHYAKLFEGDVNLAQEFLDDVEKLWADK